MTKRSYKKKNQNEKKAPTMDAFSNPAFRLGFGTLDPTQSTDYPMTRLTQNYQLLTSLYRDNWIVQNVVNTIPDDMVRKWYTLASSIDPEQTEALAKLERKTGVRQKLLNGMYWGAAIRRRGGGDADQRAG